MATEISWWLLDEVKRDRASFAQVAECELPYMRVQKGSDLVDSLHAEQFRVKFLNERKQGARVI